MSIFTVFLKHRNFISKIRISKVTDYAALMETYFLNEKKIAIKLLMDLIKGERSTWSKVMTAFNLM